MDKNIPIDYSKKANWCINPLNWKFDETYAPAGLNLGSVVLDEVTGEPEIGDVGADGRHAYDYMYYFNNIKENANKRVAAYLSKQ